MAFSFRPLLGKLSAEDDKKTALMLNRFGQAETSVKQEQVFPKRVSQHKNLPAE